MEAAEREGCVRPVETRSRGYAAPLLNQLYARPPAYEATHLQGRSVLVTGAGGSIGSVISRQLLRCGPARVVMLDAYDGNLSKLMEDLRDVAPEIEQRLVVGDVRDEHGLRDIMREHRPDFVFHAAALKHVPMLEDPFNMLEATRTNVIGTLNVLRAAMDLPDCRVVNVSTDKAVNPCSILGLTKRVAELFVRHYATRYRMPVTSVRFGNVLDSIGSCIPVFENQINFGGPVTITDERMTRFFMTADQAAALTILTSGEVAKNKAYACYLFDMGGQIAIKDLVQALIDQYVSHNPGMQGLIKTVVTGIRPGEKLYEELHYPHERVRFDLDLTHVHGLEDRSAEPDALELLAIPDAVEMRFANTLARLMSKLCPQYVGDFRA